MGTPPWETLSSYWKSEIMTEVIPVWAGDPRTVRGVLQDPKDFLKKHMLRFLMRREREGKPLPPGAFIILWKLGSDGGRHNWFRWMTGTFFVLMFSFRAKYLFKYWSRWFACATLGGVAGHCLFSVSFSMYCFSPTSGVPRKLIFVSQPILPSIPASFCFCPMKLGFS